MASTEPFKGFLGKNFEDMTEDDLRFMVKYLWRDNQRLKSELEKHESNL